MWQCLDSDLSAERSIHAQVAALEADTPTSRYLGSRRDDDTSRYSISSASARLSVGSTHSDLPEAPGQKQEQEEEQEHKLADSINNDSRERSASMERKRDSDSKNNNSGSEGCALAERKSVPSPNNQKGGTRMSVGELIGRRTHEQCIFIFIFCRVSCGGEGGREGGGGEDDEDTDEEDRSGMPTRDPAVIFMRRRQRPTTRGTSKKDVEEEEEDEDLDVTVALGDLVGSSRASSRLREKAGRSLVDTITNHARVDDSISRLNLSVTAVEGTLDITFEDKENCSSNLLREDVRPIGLENKLTPSNRRSAAFTESPILASKAKADKQKQRKKSEKCHERYDKRGCCAK